MQEGGDDFDNAGGTQYCKILGRGRRLAKAHQQPATGELTGNPSGRNRLLMPIAYAQVRGSSVVPSLLQQLSANRLGSANLVRFDIGIIAGFPVGILGTSAQNSRSAS